MIKKYLKSALILFSVLMSTTASAYTPGEWHEITLRSPEAKIDITTSKYARIDGPVNEHSFYIFKHDMDATTKLSGDRVILINSEGGYVTIGNKMLDLIHEEQKAGTRVVCFAFNKAHSMAFNLMTNCDVRIMAPRTLCLVHKVAAYGYEKRMTGKNMRALADESDKDDEPFRQANAKAMHLTLPQYDKYADDETYWTSETLLKQQYLQGLGLLDN